MSNSIVYWNNDLGCYVAYLCFNIQYSVFPHLAVSVVPFWSSDHGTIPVMAENLMFSAVLDGCIICQLALIVFILRTGKAVLTMQGLEV